MNMAGVHTPLQYPALLVRVTKAGEPELLQLGGVVCAGVYNMYLYIYMILFVCVGGWVEECVYTRVALYVF